MKRIGQERQNDSDDENTGDDIMSIDFPSLNKRQSRVRAVLDDWIVVEGTDKETIDLLLTARDEINTALEYKVMYPQSELPAETGRIIDDIADMYEAMDDTDDYSES